MSAAVALAALFCPSIPSAAPPPGVAYDEIVRVVVNATPPPPGNFQADLAVVNTQVAAAPTPPPKKRGFNLGSLAGVIAQGGVSSGNVGENVAGAVAAEAISAALENAVQQSLGAQFGALGAVARSFLQPHLMRYAYYNGWERVEDVSGQTATIRKCDLGQVVRLDLARKTFTVYTPDAEPTDAPAPPPSRRGRAPSDSGQPAAPGSGTVELSATTKSLGQLRIEGQPTSGYDSTVSFAMTKSTGSCHDGNASIRSVEYISSLAQPTVNSCPIRRRPVPQTATEAVTPPSSGGCRPTFSAHRSGPTPPTSRLSLYSLVTFAGGAGATPAPQASPAMGSLGFLTERGNLKTLGAADASLFEVPQGFTKAP